LVHLLQESIYAAGQKKTVEARTMISTSKVLFRVPTKKKERQSSLTTFGRSLYFHPAGCDLDLPDWDGGLVVENRKSMKTGKCFIRLFLGRKINYPKPLLFTSYLFYTFLIDITQNF
jgi:hypothetical protein